MKNKLFQWILVLFIIVLVVGSVYFGVKYFINSQYNPVDKNDTSIIEIEIPSGSSISKISSILYENDLIKNGTFFKWRANKSHDAKEYRSGTFRLSKSMSVDEIIEELTKKEEVNNENSVKLVIPEGFERKQIAKRIEDLNLGSAKRFLELSQSKEKFQDEYPFLESLNEGQSLEGYLFPATYNIAMGTSEEEIIKKMLNAFKDRYEKNILGKDFKGLNLNQLITLASIIEREGKLDEERPLMSAVFRNRLAIDMPLQSCATVQFILGERKPVLSNSDISIESPFNTYKNKGLPPAPIANPGLASINAALNPADVNYLFFVLTGEDGSHTFSETYEDHLKAKENMIK